MTRAKQYTFNREADLQRYLVNQLRGIKCLVYKFASPSKRGVPDLLILTPVGTTIFVEMKNPSTGGVLSKLQRVEIAKMQDHNATVYIAAKKADCDDIINLIKESVKGFKQC